LLAWSYHKFRRPRREAEIHRVFDILRLDKTVREAFDSEDSGTFLSWAVFYTSIVSLISMAVLLFPSELGIVELPAVKVGDTEFPRPGSRLVMGMALLGGYVWGIQHLLARYSRNDLLPVVYYQLSSRMILAGVVSVALYNGYSALIGGSDEAFGMDAWPVIGLLVGMFPQRGLRWLTDRVPFLSPKSESSVIPSPLDLVEGIQSEDILRFNEMGISDCYNLARADYIPLVLRTPYSARELLDWILQAKLCALFTESLPELRQNGVRTALDLKKLTPEDITTMAQGTKLTERGLTQGRELIDRDEEVDRLQAAAAKLSHYLRDKHALDDD
ncbi:MAG: hypothetical protein OES99_12360, partial [Gammaproteobacteria bacterium]|nr:hypothetical protein [Gammaproteobacteria bacterium]